ncbi:DEAD/DEAH box helicase [Xenorhabdus griffiniae]|uniref:DEAD/DEAH box helicase n=1 Tax=Xenorhabdus griffiniae TaxID=351672 RepID=A0ABY9XFR1_9GAMM|nr:DEAD/DEAH box helicase [Xenorhabdus griffiniae]MBD1227694.1 DEAD/DEAH box helicase [Xenorhabdus griffiniae]MBE8587015.1 DEAD/DEAH box helicase [Xenorhabdus griffiniae]WMV71680.1 DEAD/DEAH box helicase [Xenorhabdus griffiniae]WNH01357.1 DEAD/DEAH box helicase [Xenorhabdus griffiniae]
MLEITPNFAQERGLSLLRQHWKQHRTFMVYSPTGSGKTGLAAFITDGYVSRGMRVMFCVPYTILVDQTAKKFAEYGLPGDEIAFVWRDHPNQDPSKLIQIASADTLIRRDFPEDISLLVIDEAHLKRKKILEEITRLTTETDCKVIGLSGTPFSPFLGHYYQKLIKPTTIKELIQRGDLSAYEFYAPTKPDLTGVKSSSSAEYGSDYKEDEIAEIMCGADLVGDVVSSWLKLGENQPTICFCVNVSHANFITVEFNRAGVNAEVMTANTPHDERDLIIHRFEQGATKIIVNVGVLVAGFDSDVRCIIYARPTKSEIRWLQTIGRGLRIAEGKNRCIILDHSGSVHRLGYPDDIEYDELPNKNDGMKTRSSYREQEKREKLPKECTSCHYMKPAGVYVCPKCGFKPLAGEDIEVDTSRTIQKLNKKARVYTQAEKQSFYSQLKYYQNQRASQGKILSDGWVSNTFKDKFGVWPRGFHDTPQELTPEVNNFIRHKQIAWAKSRKRVEQPQQGGML